MLVLSRKCNERIVVDLNGETVTIEVLQIKGGRVRIDAPAQIAIHREELWHRLTAEHRAETIMGREDQGVPSSEWSSGSLLSVSVNEDCSDKMCG